jgi:hypothetical protein
VTGKLIDFAAFKAKKQAAETSGATALARTEDAPKPAKRPAAKRKRKDATKAPMKKARKKAQPRIRTSREVFVRCTKATPSLGEYKSACGYLTLDRVDKQIVRVTFDPILNEDLKSLDIDTNDTTYDAEKRVYRVRDVDDDCIWRFTRLKRVKS